MMMRLNSLLKALFMDFREFEIFSMNVLFATSKIVSLKETIINPVTFLWTCPRGSRFSAECIYVCVYVVLAQVLFVAKRVARQ